MTDRRPPTRQDTARVLTAIDQTLHPAPPIETWLPGGPATELPQGVCGVCGYARTAEIWNGKFRWECPWADDHKAEAAGDLEPIRDECGICGLWVFPGDALAPTIDDVIGRPICRPCRNRYRNALIVWSNHDPRD